MKRNCLSTLLDDYDTKIANLSNNNLYSISSSGRLVCGNDKKQSEISIPEGEIIFKLFIFEPRTFALCESGHVYAWDTISSSAIIVQELNALDIQYITVGFGTTALTKQGYLLQSGPDLYSDKFTVLPPHLPLHDKLIRSMVGLFTYYNSSNKTAVITSEGELYFWGYLALNYHGTKAARSPVKVDLPYGEKVRDVSLSDHYWAFLTESGRVFVNGIVPGEEKFVDTIKEIASPALKRLYCFSELMFGIDSANKVYVWSQYNKFCFLKGFTCLDFTDVEGIRQLNMTDSSIYYQDNNGHLKLMLNKSYECQLIKAIKANDLTQFIHLKREGKKFLVTIDAIVYALDSAGCTEPKIFLEQISPDMLSGDSAAEILHEQLCICFSFISKLTKTAIYENQWPEILSCLKRRILENSFPHEKGFLQRRKDIFELGRNFTEDAFAFAPLPFPNPNILGRNIYSKEDYVKMLEAHGDKKSYLFDNALNLLDLMKIRLQYNDDIPHQEFKRAISYILAISAYLGKEEIFKSKTIFKIIQKLAIDFNEACISNVYSYYECARSESRTFSPITLAIMFAHKRFIAKAYAHGFMVLDDLYSHLIFAAKLNNADILGFMLDLFAQDYPQTVIQESIELQFRLNYACKYNKAEEQIMYHVFSNVNFQAFEKLYTYKIDLHFPWNKYFAWNALDNVFTYTGYAMAKGDIPYWIGTGSEWQLSEKGQLEISKMIHKILQHHYAINQDEDDISILLKRHENHRKTVYNEVKCDHEQTFLSLMKDWNSKNHLKTVIVDGCITFKYKILSIQEAYRIAVLDNDFEHLKVVLDNIEVIPYLRNKAVPVTDIAIALYKNNYIDLLKLHCKNGKLSRFDIDESVLDIFQEILGNEGVKELFKKIDNLVTLLSIKLDINMLTARARIDTELFKCILHYADKLLLWNRHGVNAKEILQKYDDEQDMVALDYLLDNAEYLTQYFSHGSSFEEISILTLEKYRQGLKNLNKCLWSKHRYNDNIENLCTSVCFLLYKHMTLSQLVQFSKNDEHKNILDTILSNYKMVSQLIEKGVSSEQILQIASTRPTVLQRSLSNNRSVDEAYSQLKVALDSMQEENPYAFFHRQKIPRESSTLLTRSVQVLVIKNTTNQTSNTQERLAEPLNIDMQEEISCCFIS